MPPTIPRVAARLLLLALPFALPALAAEPSPPAMTTMVERGLSAVWHNPERDGEGWALEILNDGQAVMAWFTYDDAGKPRWMYAQGRTLSDDNGPYLFFSNLEATRGGRFGPDFDPDDVESDSVGSLSMRFSDCQQGEIEYSAYGHAERIPIQRLMRTMGAACDPPHGRPGEPVHPLAGQSGSWLDPSRAGEGIELLWTADGNAVLGWYTYTPDGDPFWLIGLGQRSVEGEGEAQRIVFPALYSARGGRFGEQYDPTLVERLPWGRLELDLGCSTGTATFQSDLPAFGTGTLNLRLLTRAAQTPCPWTTRGLSHLYSIHTAELPASTSPSPAPATSIEARHLADDGTVVGYSAFTDGQGRVMRIGPLDDGWTYEASWSMVGDGLPGVENAAVFITPDAGTVYAQRGTPSGTVPMRWREDTGWEALPGLVLQHSTLTGMSQDGRHLVGEGAVDGVWQAWRWNEDEGQVLLSLGEEIRTGVPRAISNDGQTVVGETLAPVGDWPAPLAIVWRGEQAPQVLQLQGHDGQALGAVAGCSNDCDVILGWGQRDQDSDGIFEPGGSDQPETLFAGWYHTTRAGYGAFAMPSDWVGNTFVQTLDASADGSLAVGSYANALTSPLPNDGFIWTQDTGSVPLHTILADGVADAPGRTHREAGRVSRDGQRILVRWNTAAGAALNRAAVIRLTPESDMHFPTPQPPERPWGE